VGAEYWASFIGGRLLRGQRAFGDGLWESKPTDVIDAFVALWRCTL
jgi:hypothetical protein